MRILGVDLGKKRIGLAISDEAGSIAFPAGALESRGAKRDVAALRKLISERQIARAVVGLPLHLDGRHGPEADRAVRFAESLSRAAGIPVDTFDERWTSREAERLIEPASPRRRRARREKGTVDEMAASILLRTYLAGRPQGLDDPAGLAGGSDAAKDESKGEATGEAKDGGEQNR